MSQVTQAADLVVIGSGKPDTNSSSYRALNELTQALSEGWNGLCARKHTASAPRCQVAEPDEQPAIGGVWGMWGVYIQG